MPRQGDADAPTHTVASSGNRMLAIARLRLRNLAKTFIDAILCRFGQAVHTVPPVAAEASAPPFDVGLNIYLGVRSRLDLSRSIALHRRNQSSSSQ